MGGDTEVRAAQRWKVGGIDGRDGIETGSYEPLTLPRPCFWGNVGRPCRDRAVDAPACQDTPAWEGMGLVLRGTYVAFRTEQSLAASFCGGCERRGGMWIDCLWPIHCRS